ncbi:lymphocyte antigen 86 isoform X4 [Rhinatrema bivittatum]|uniref:lymphocyte antigen 86 isoform X4 n=1 Tax=Rhinatrema bivittatum TaxID=194408 RepID=UPI001125C2EA|nr:lymphocyte antigen 86 isoform X4 [Rhinatrema bivittatum]
MDMLSMEGATQDSTTQTGGYDPLQDIGFSMEPCTKVLPDVLHIKLALLLRRDIRQLVLKISIFKQSLKLFSFSYPLCEQTSTYYSFCGRKKGEFIYFEGPIKSGISTVPKEEYDLSLELINEDMYNIACVNITLIGH